MNSINLTEIPAHYINLKKDVEKNKNVSNLLTNLEFITIKRHEGILHDKSNVGCSRAHYQALKKLNTPFILFEDDVVELDFKKNIHIPIDADAIYLGNSSWGRFNSSSGPFLRYRKETNELYRIFNMLSGHAILYLSEEYKEVCKKISYYFGYVLEDHYQDIGFAEIQKYFNVYCFNSPMFFQTSNPEATNKKLMEYPIEKVDNGDFFLPTDV